MRKDKKDMKVCAFKKDNGCTVLNRADCNGCAFFKTEKQLEEGRAKAMERVNSLPEDFRHYIKGKYYSSEPKGMRGKQ